MTDFEIIVYCAPFAFGFCFALAAVILIFPGNHRGIA